MTEDFKRKLTAILSADVVGYSRLMGDDEAATVKTLETYKGVMSSLIKQHRGRVVDSPGDNLLAEFGSVVDAVQCAVSLQKELQTRNSDLPENRRMEFRIGINLGDVIEEEDRIYGDGVNIAARLEALADPGGICISKTAFDHIESKLPLGYEFLGEQTVKNISKPVGAYKVLMETRVVDTITKREVKTLSLIRRKSVLSLSIIVILAIVFGLYWSFYSRGPSIEPVSVENMAHPLPDKPSIAVLPFKNETGNPDQDYIGDGLSGSICDALSVSSQVFVIDRNATFIYKDTPVKPQQVAKDLGVQYILDGSIQKSGDQLRITARLIDALAGHYLWSDKYTRDIKELFEVEDEITKKIMVSLQVELSGNEDLRVYAKSTDNLEAWKHYIKGIELYDIVNAGDNLKAREHFKAALELDPDFVSAYSMLAQTHAQDFIWEWNDSPINSMNRAVDLAQKAVEMDEQDPVAHAVLGWVFINKKQYEEAIVEGKRAITLNPNYAFGNIILANILYYSGRFDESITLLQKATRINPNIQGLNLYTMVANNIFLERYEEALEVTKLMEKNALPGSRLEAFYKTLFSWIYQEIGREDEARAYMAEALKIKPDYSLENFVSYPYKDSTHLHRMLDAYRKAGMPEHPPGAVQEKPSIAVLPFDDLSPKKDQEYFVLGLSEEILNYISKISGLHVTSKTSSFAFRDTNKTIKEIAEILDRDYILEGSVRKSGNNIKITAQLIRAEDDSHLWSETYDRELDDIFQIQEDIAKNVASKLKLTLEAFQFGGTENVDAYEKYLVAKGQAANGEWENALESIKKAIAHDPGFALAYAYKGSVHLFLATSLPIDRSGVELDFAEKSALKAIELDPDLGKAHLILGTLFSWRREYIKAEKAYRKGMALKIDSSDYFEYGLTSHYGDVGYLKKNHELLEKVLENDPLQPVLRSFYIFSLGLIGDMQGAEDEYKLFKTRFGNLKDITAVAYTHLLMLRIGKKDDIPLNEIPEGELKNNLIKLVESPKEEREKIFQSLVFGEQNINSTFINIITCFAAYFFEPEYVMTVLETNSGITGYTWIPLMKEVRQLPRFKEYVKETGLVDYWKEYGWPDLCRPVGNDDFECE